MTKFPYLHSFNLLQVWIVHLYLDCVLACYRLYARYTLGNLKKSMCVPNSWSCMVKIPVWSNIGFGKKKACGYIFHLFMTLYDTFWKLIDFISLNTYRTRDYKDRRAFPAIAVRIIKGQLQHRSEHQGCMKLLRVYIWVTRTGEYLLQ